MEFAPKGHPREIVNFCVEEDGETLVIWATNAPCEGFENEEHIITMSREVAIHLAQSILKQMDIKIEDL